MRSFGSLNCTVDDSDGSRDVDLYACIEFTVFRRLNTVPFATVPFHSLAEVIGNVLRQR